MGMTVHLSSSSEPSCVQNLCMFTSAAPPAAHGSGTRSRSAPLGAPPCSQRQLWMQQCRSDRVLHLYPQRRALSRFVPSRLTLTPHPPGLHVAAPQRAPAGRDERREEEWGERRRAHVTTSPTAMLGEGRARLQPP